MQNILTQETYYFISLSVLEHIYYIIKFGLQKSEGFLTKNNSYVLDNAESIDTNS